MTCEEIKISLHDYIDEQLDIVTKNEIKNHLYTCDLCFKEYQRLRGFFDLLKRLPYTLEPKENIIEVFSKELLDGNIRENADDPPVTLTEKKKVERERRKQEERLKANRSVAKKSRAYKTIGSAVYSRRYLASTGKWKKILLFPVFFLILAAAYFVYDFQKRNSPWNFELLSGNAFVNGMPAVANKLSEKEILRTGENSEAVLFVPRTGKIELLSGSEVVLGKAKNDENEVRIDKGSIRVIGTVDMPGLIIDYSHSAIALKNGTFSVNIDSAGNALVTVENGFVEIQFGEEKIYVRDGYVCRIKSGGTPGIPYRINAVEDFKKIVEQFNNASDNDTLGKNIISTAGKDDMLTLLAMIPRVSQLQRQILFQTIANHFPPPLNVTRLGILKADQEMIYEWWEEMEWQL